MKLKPPLKLVWNGKSQKGSGFWKPEVYKPKYLSLEPWMVDRARAEGLGRRRLRLVESIASTP
jgi:hypothetical protein